MGKDARESKVYTDRRSRSSGSTASRDRRAHQSSSPSPDTRVIVTRVEQANSPIEVPPGAVATTKHEEWTTKKKVQQVVTKEVETRVQRQLVTEDGRVVEDSGPQITQQTREEKKINEEEDIQHKTPTGEPLTGGYIVAPGAAVITTKTESRQKSHEVKEDHKETHDEQVEEISGEEFHRRAVMGHDVGEGALVRRSGTPSSNFSSTGPRIVNQYSKRHKVTDKDDIQEISREKGGAVTTERTITHQTEEEADDEIPEDAADEVDHYRGERKMITYSPTYHAPEREHHLHVRRDDDHERENHLHVRRDDRHEGEHHLHVRRDDHHEGEHHREKRHREHQHQQREHQHRERHHQHREHQDQEHHHRHRESETRSSGRSKREKYRESKDTKHRSHGHSSRSLDYGEVDESRRNTESRHREKRHAHKTRSISPSNRDVSPVEHRTGTMRSDASSQTRTPSDPYYKGDYEYDPHRRSEHRDKKGKDDFSSVRRHESFHHEARSSYTPFSEKQNLHRSHSQRSVATTTEDHGDQSYLYGSIDRRHRSDRHRDLRSPSPHSSKSPTQRYYLGEDPWRGSPTPRDDRSHSRSGGIRKDDLSKFYEQRHRDYSPASRNRKDLYAWEDHRSRDFYSHTTKMDEEERNAYADGSRHGSGLYRDDYKDYRVKSYSQTPAEPSYSISAYSKSENREKDPNEPHKELYRTTSKSQSEDIQTTPLHDGGKNVTHSKVRQKHYRSEMKYGDRGFGSSPPNSPPPTNENMYYYDAIDGGSYDRRHRSKEMRENLGQSDTRRQEVIHDIQDEGRFSGFEHGYSNTPTTHYKAPSQRQRSPDTKSTRDDTINLFPDYSNRSRRFDDSQEDPVLKPPTFTPLQSPLSVKTADEVKTPVYSKFDRDNESLRGTDDYNRIRIPSLHSDVGKENYSFKDFDYLHDSSAKFQSKVERESDSVLSFDKESKSSRSPTRYQPKADSDSSSLKRSGHDSKYRSIFDKDSAANKRSDDGPRYTSGLTPLKKLDRLPDTYDSLTRKEDRDPLSSMSSIDPLPKYDRYDSIKKKNEWDQDNTPTRTPADLLPKRQSTPEPVKKLDTTNYSVHYHPRYSRSTYESVTPSPQNLKSTTPERKTPSPEPRSLPSSFNPTSTYQSKYSGASRQTPTSPPRKQKEREKIVVEPIIEPLTWPDLTRESPMLSDKDDKDNESVKSDKSRTSTRTFTLEDSNTNSLKKIHVNPAFRADAAASVVLKKKPAKPIKEEVPLEPMKQIPKPSTKKRAPIPDPTTAGRTTGYTINTDTYKKSPSQKVPPVAPKRTKGSQSAKAAKKPVLVEVRGWENR